MGKTLVRHACSIAREMGKPYLTVKTLGPSAGHEAYKRTWAFYEAVGFMGLKEFSAIGGSDVPVSSYLMPVSA
jgi:hypothetical protein